MIGPSLQAHTGKSLIRWRSLANNLEFYDEVNEVIQVRGYRSNTRGELAEKKRSNVRERGRGNVIVAKKS